MSEAYSKWEGHAHTTVQVGGSGWVECSHQPALPLGNNLCSYVEISSLRRHCRLLLGDGEWCFGLAADIPELHWRRSLRSLCLVLLSQWDMLPFHRPLCPWSLYTSCPRPMESLPCQLNGRWCLALYPLLIDLASASGLLTLELPRLFLCSLHMWVYLSGSLISSFWAFPSSHITSNYASEETN